MADAADAALAAALRSVPLLAAIDRDKLEVSRLGGLTNLVYRVRALGDTFCLRIPGPGTAEYIDRKAEQVNARAAASAGIAPAVLYYGDDGVMLMPMLDGATMSPKLFAEPGAAARAGAALKRLHGSGEQFASKFELFEQIDKYLAELGTDAKLPDGYAAALETAQSVRAALAAQPLPSAPCHCDPLCENFIDDGAKIWIIDFEYGGMNDPLWDLGDLCVEAALDGEREAELLLSYFGAPPSPAERGRVVLYKAMCDLLWTLWGLLQHKNGNPAEDFWAYSLERFARCTKLMATPEFMDVHVAAVLAG